MARRPFRGLRDRPPRADYDAVVIGSGVGGLVTACLLQRGGLRTLLVERHYMLGGYCSSFRRGGFTFDASTHFYPLLGNPETLTGRLLHELGVETRWVRMDPVDTFHLPDGSSFEVPADLDRYRASLDARFPESVAALDRFFTEVRAAYLAGTLAYFRGRETPGFRRLRDLDLGAVLAATFEDPRLRLVLTADVPHWGAPPSRTSFVFDSMLRLSYFLGNYYPVGGSQAFADELGRVFEEAGGDLMIHTAAERIRVRDGRVEGVDLATGRGALRGRHAVDAGIVVSNADLRLTLERLLPPEARDPAELARVRALRPSCPCALAHLGLGAVDPEVLHRAQGYWWSDWDPESVASGGLRLKIFVPTLYDPGVAPPGKHVVLLQKVRRPVGDAGSGPGAGGIREGPAADDKAALEADLRLQLATVAPELASAVEVWTTASADTARRFTANHGGAMLGWEMAPDQLGDRRPGIEGPVSGLFRVGHWVRPGGGITPVIVSAMQVAEAITGRNRVR